MRDHIHTIPVLDALREPGHCPFCTMYHRLDKNAVDFIMGPAYMDEDIRDATNEAGFCEDHLKKLYAVQNRLGAALLLHTHLKQLQKDISNMTYVIDKNPKSSFFKKSESKIEKLGKHIKSQQSRCYLCEKIEGTFQRYIETFFHMWPREPEARDLVAALPGFCLPHFGMMMAMAESSLSKKHLDSFLEVVVPLQAAAIATIEADLDWFIQKFDYRNNEAPWKNSQDAIPRTIALLKGTVI